MNLDKYTIKSQEVIQKAIEGASVTGQQAIEPGHILHALLTAGENVISFILKKLNVNQNQLEVKLEEIIGYSKLISGILTSVVLCANVKILSVGVLIIPWYKRHSLIPTHLFVPV